MASIVRVRIGDGMLEEALFALIAIAGVAQLIVSQGFSRYPRLSSAVWWLIAGAVAITVLVQDERVRIGLSLALALGAVALALYMGFLSIRAREAKHDVLGGKPRRGK